MAKLTISGGVALVLCIAVVLMPFRPATADYNVVDFGARPGGQTDSTQPFLKAWSAACNSAAGPATVYVPQGTFSLMAITFSGPCQNRITFQIDGTLVAPWDYRTLGNTGNWIVFDSVDWLSVYGGTIDGRGAAYWACLESGGNCGVGAKSIMFLGTNNVVVSGLTSLNSQSIHIAVDLCNNVLFQNIRTIAPGDSPNTDGMHLQFSTGITIRRSSFMTGDDCISIGQGSKNVWIQKIRCGPGHGISIGSLGNGLNEAGVQNVTVTNSVFTNTQNGVRIKSWARPSNGFASNIVFKNLIMNGAGNPIIIDQTYCPNYQCPHMSSGVQVTDVTYSNIRGTSATPAAVTFNCSPSNPCRRIRMRNVKLTYANQQATSLCANAVGVSLSGIVIPDSC